MKVKNLAKGLLATAAFALAIMVTPASIVKAEGAQSTYTVERGGNLSKIAKKIYGDEKLWRVIYNANSSVVKSDYIIYKNQVLIIPAVDNNSAPAVQMPVPAVTTPAPAATTPAPAPAATTPAPAASDTKEDTPATTQEAEGDMVSDEIFEELQDNYAMLVQYHDAIVEL